MIGKIILITLQWQWTPENFFEFSLRKGKMIKMPFVCIVRLEGRGHKAQNTVAGRREVCVLVSLLGAWGHQVSLLCCREPHLCAVLRMLPLCCVMLMFPLASASLDEDAAKVKAGLLCQETGSADWLGGIFFSVTCLGVFGHDFSHQAHHFTSLHQFHSL